MSAYYSSYQTTSQPTTSPSSASPGPSVASMAAAAAFHWNPFSDFSVPYYFPGGQNVNSRYQPSLQNYYNHHHHHHHHPLHHQPHPHPENSAFQQQFTSYSGGVEQAENCNAASSPSPPTSGVHSNSESPTHVKTDPTIEDRLQSYSQERYSARLSNTPDTKVQTFPQRSPVSTPSGQNIYDHHQQSTLHLHRTPNLQLQTNHASSDDSNSGRVIRDFLAHSNSSAPIMTSGHVTEFGGCISPSTLGTTSTEPASPYYDMYGSASNATSIGSKGSSFYPWMKHYSRKNYFCSLEKYFL